MTISFLDPRAEPGAIAEPYELSVNHVDGLSMGLLANGFPDSERFLDQLETAVSEKWPSVNIRRYNKGNASVVANDEMLDALTKECACVITAYGH